MALHNEWGKRAEDLALEWWLARGSVRVLARNYRCRRGEIDLVLELAGADGGGVELVFVEVRARASGAWVDGVESVDWDKRRKLDSAIRHFLASYRGRAVSARMDILAWDGRTWSHRENVWS